MIYLTTLLAFTLVSGAATKPPETNLDKFGTTAWKGESRDSQVPETSVVATRGSLNAERAGNYLSLAAAYCQSSGYGNKSKCPLDL
jgi:hypothetical protein